MAEQPFLIAEQPWIEVKDGDDTVRSIFDRHYSRYHYKDGRKPKLFVGPGEKTVLITPDARNIFVWRKFISGDGQQGVNCAVFRKEGDGQASDLILLAEQIAWRRWPGERFYTYINPDALKIPSHKYRKPKEPGHCFIKAGWRPCGTTKSGLLILEKLPR